MRNSMTRAIGRTMTKIVANGIAVEAECHGPATGRPILLIRGLGSQLIHWPRRMIDGLVDEDFYVIVYDNRDSGLSQKFDAVGGPDTEPPGADRPDNLSVEVPYRISDMARDAVGVLDAFGIGTAHVLGISMGGMILQTLASDFPERLRSAIIVASSSGSPNLPPRSPEVEDLLLSGPDAPGREAFIAHTLKCDRIWGSPGYPFDEGERRALIARAHDRCYCPAGVSRQYAAIAACQTGFADLESIAVPTLVIHGTDDALLPLAHGMDIAARIPGAELITIPGMGHDLEGEIPDMIVGHVVRLAERLDDQKS